MASVRLGKTRPTVTTGGTERSVATVMIPLGETKHNPIVLSMGVEVYKNQEGRYVVNTADLKKKVEKMLRKQGYIA